MSETRDIVDWALDIGQVISALGAVAAVIFAVIAMRRSDAGLIRERRIDFELGMLVELADLSVQSHGTGLATAKFTVRAATLPADLVPLARAAVGLPTTPNAHLRAEQRRSEVGPQVHTRDLLAEDIRQEILAAINTRLHQR